MADVQKNWKKLPWQMRLALALFLSPALLFSIEDLGTSAQRVLKNQAAPGASSLSAAGKRPLPGVPGSDRGSTGTTAAVNDEVRVNLTDNGTVGVTITGTWVATHIFEATTNGIDWFSVNAYPPTTLTAVTTTAANGNWIVPVAGMGALRVRRSASTSGTATITVRAGPFSFFAPGTGGGGGGVVDTEFGAAVASSDAAANPTAPQALTYGSVFNGTTWDRQRTTVNDGTQATVLGSMMTTPLIWKGGTTWGNIVSGGAVADGNAGGGPLANIPYIYNGTTFDRQRSAGADALAATGLGAAANLVWNGSSWDRQKGNTTGTFSQGTSATGGALTGNPHVIAGLDTSNNIQIPTVRAAFGDASSATPTSMSTMSIGYAFNGSSIDRVRSANGADGTTGTGLLGSGAMGFDGTNWNRLRVNSAADPLLKVSAGGFTATNTCLFTRGANTTAYTIGDEVGTAGTAPTTLAVARLNGGTGVIQGATAVYSNTPVVTPGLVVLIFSATVTLAGDNAQLNLSDSDAAKCIGFINLVAAQPGVYSAGSASTSGNLIMHGVPQTPLHFTTGGSETTLYVALMTTNAFTPIANSETIQVKLELEQN